MSNTSLKIIFIFSLTITILIAMIIIKYIMLTQVSATLAIIETQAPMSERNIIHTIDTIVITGDSGVSDIGTQIIILNKPKALIAKPIKVEQPVVVVEESNVFIASPDEEPIVVSQPDGYSSKLGY